MLTVPFDFLQRSIFYTGVLSFFVLNLMEKKQSLGQNQALKQLSEI